jgi:Spy/CpxP family protein refolding chaperone
MFTRVLFYFLGLILAGMAGTSWVLAQPGGGAGGGFRPPAGGYQAQPSAVGEGFQDKFREVKRTQMGPALGVNQQTVDRLLQIEKRYQPLRQALIRDMKTEYRRLGQVMSQPSPSDQEVKVILSNMKRKQQEMQNLQLRQGEEEEALLTPVQQARYIMYQKSLLKEARSIKGGPGETAPFTPQVPREIPVSRPAAPPR